jgi:hypothetical protein
MDEIESFRGLPGPLFLSPPVGSLFLSPPLASNGFPNDCGNAAFFFSDFFGAGADDDDDDDDEEDDDDDDEDDEIVTADDPAPGMEPACFAAAIIPATFFPPTPRALPMPGGGPAVDAA